MCVFFRLVKPSASLAPRSGRGARSRGTRRGPGHDAGHGGLAGARRPGEHEVAQLRALCALLKQTPSRRAKRNIFGAWIVGTVLKVPPTWSVSLWFLHPERGPPKQP